MNTSPMGRTHRILLIERDPSVRELMNEVLVEANYNVLKREYPLDPTELQNDRPDLIILDVPTAATSPELDLVSHLKSDGHTAHIPILALGKAYPSPDVSAWTQQIGVAGFLLKPFDLEEFMDAVQSALESTDTAVLEARHEPPVHHVDPKSAPPPAW